MQPQQASSGANPAPAGSGGGNPNASGTSSTSARERPPRPSSEPSLHDLQAGNVLQQMSGEFGWGYVCGQLQEIKETREMQTLDLTYQSLDGTTNFSYKV